MQRCRQIKASTLIKIVSDIVSGKMLSSYSMHYSLSKPLMYYWWWSIQIKPITTDFFFIQYYCVVYIVTVHVIILYFP